MMERIVSGTHRGAEPMGRGSGPRKRMIAMKKLSFLMLALLGSALVVVPALVRSQAGAGKDAAPEPAQDNALPLEQVIQKVQANYAKVQTYMADFDQQLYSVTQGREISQGSGFVIYKKPGKMVWHYGKPEEHFYFADGNTLIDYSPTEKEAYVLPLRDVTIRSFLFGMGDLKKDFEVSYHGGRALTPSGLYQLDLVPKDPTDREAFGTITVYLDPKNDFLVSFTLMTDALGNENRMKFVNIRINDPIDDAKFKFTPPPDVKVTQAKDIADDGKK
jgi:outer membrane lipoprotein carrier protein